MAIFASFGGELSYHAPIQLDGAFSVCHINYGKSPMFTDRCGAEIAIESRIGSLSSADHIDDVLGCSRGFDGTEKGFSASDRIELWESYWLEYLGAFDALATSLPYSIATVFVGRHAIELGLKYLLLKHAGDFPKTHNLGELVNRVFEECGIEESYMDWIADYCELYGRFIEGDNAEYFRFPEYRGNAFFAGNHLDIHWLSYNCALVLLKLIHFAELDNEVLSQ